MTIKEKIIALCTDNNLSTADFIKGVEKEVAKLVPFNHNADSFGRACGIQSEFGLMVKGAGPVSTAVENLEENYTKRQIAVVFIDMARHNGMMHQGAAPSNGSPYDQVDQLLKNISEDADED